jgi:thiamine-monophosphate kinase
VPRAEKALIAQIRQIAESSTPGRTGSQNHAILAGIGDDCAVVRLTVGKDSLITTDFSLEGIHFRRDWHSPESIAHRCLARGLSDIAAMGGTPVAVFLSLALPRDLPQSWVGDFSRSLVSLAERNGATLAGGDTAESPNDILADIIVVGTVPKGKAILRSGAKAGDKIYVSGELGGSAAAVIRMQTRGKAKKVHPRDYGRHFFPEPRVELGRYLQRKRLASAMIDTSDGLSTDLAHICEESSVGAEINSSLIPRASVGRPAREVALNLSLHAGEDYELLFTAHASKRIPSKVAGVAITQIGNITRARGLYVRNEKGVRHELRPQGWEHFQK